MLVKSVIDLSLMNASLNAPVLFASLTFALFTSRSKHGIEKCDTLTKRDNVLRTK